MISWAQVKTRLQIFLNTVTIVIIQQMRKKMIDAEKGHYTINTLVKSQDEVTIVYMFFDCTSQSYKWICWYIITFTDQTTLLPSKRYMDQGQRLYTYAPVKGTDYRWISNSILSTCHKMIFNRIWKVVFHFLTIWHQGVAELQMLRTGRLLKTFHHNFIKQFSEVRKFL